jgi:hypothetical protein
VCEYLGWVEIHREREREREREKEKERERERNGYRVTFWRAWV